VCTVVMVFRSVRRQKMPTMPLYKAIMERTNYVHRFAGIRQLVTIGRIFHRGIQRGDLKLHDYTQRGTWQSRLLKGLKPITEKCGEWEAITSLEVTRPRTAESRQSVPSEWGASSGTPSTRDEV
jgi:hypothetical protein